MQKNKCTEKPSKELQVVLCSEQIEYKFEGVFIIKSNMMLHHRRQVYKGEYEHHDKGCGFHF